MPVTTRGQLPPRGEPLSSNSPTAGLKTTDADTNPVAPDVRRSKRLRHDNDNTAENLELPPQRRRRKHERSLKEDSSASKQRADGRDAIAAEETSNARPSPLSMRRDTSKKAAGNSRPARERPTAGLQASSQASGRVVSTARKQSGPTAPRSSAALTRVDGSPAAPESQYAADPYENPPATNNQSGQHSNTRHARQPDDEDLNPHDSEGLFVEQDEDDDAQLYDDATMMGKSPEANGRGKARFHTDAPEQEQEQEVNTQQLRNLGFDMGPAPPEPLNNAIEVQYPDDQFIFKAPAGCDRRRATQLKSTALKSMVEIMSETGWTRTNGWSKVVDASKRDLRSTWSGQIWHDLKQLRAFWGSMPRAPGFEEQCNYLHPDDPTQEGAATAKETVAKVDDFVEKTVEKARKVSKGREEMMSPKPSTIDLHEKIIPILVYSLRGVFRKGVEVEAPPWQGMFTKPTLQIMQRLLAWIKTLYRVMIDGLKRRPREQRLRETRSREKLGKHLRDFQAELEHALEDIDAAHAHDEDYEERLQRRQARKQRELQEMEERKRKQRELVNSRIEKMARRLPDPSRRPKVPPLQQIAREPERVNQARATSRATSGWPSASWSDEDFKRILHMLREKPNTTVRLLAVEVNHSKQEVKAVVELFKQSARTCAASMNKPIPEFAAI